MRTRATTSTQAPLSKLAIPVERSTILADNVVALTALGAQQQQRQQQQHSEGITRIPKGRNVSGRNWKVRAQKRASSLVKTRINNNTKSFADRQALKRARVSTLALQRELADRARQAAVAKREQRAENEKRRAENEYRNAQKSIQTLNVHRVGTTLKTMSKKQLRQIKKTRVNAKTGVVELVSPYAK